MSEKKTTDHALGMVLLRETIEKVHGLQMESWGGKKRGAGTVALMLDGIENRLEVAESMLRGDGEWRKHKLNTVVQKWLKWEAEWKAAEERPVEAARRPAEGPGEAGSHTPPSEACGGLHGAPTGIHGDNFETNGERA